MSFEGIDGSGKSTQAKMCYDALNELGIKTVLTREPGGEAIAEEIREILLYSKEEVHPITEMLLYAAARSQHVKKIIEPNINCGSVVVCDRFVHSSIAYQGYGLGLDIDTVWQVNKVAMGGVYPDIIFLFDLPVDIALNRSNARRESIDCRESLENSEVNKRDRIEARGNDFYNKVREGFLELAKDPKVKILDATQPPYIIHKEVMKIIRDINMEKNS